ncbi:hypothetical protein EUX98_g1458 [Antrodiella citrinella]|uniref:Senescence domain-containing protein n=1 Tax=Antrodiella citrinella TaxID=2447956 RepID=A0A4S4N3R0_9APHY|nr:hypothetical protein EUX98_g1458 [Antrodiella citrinella]
MSSSTTNITIPGVVATHVVAKSEVELGNGDLTLIVAAPQASGATVETTPILTLTVGKAAFPLFNNTDFGTVAGDERLYVFSPQVGEKVGYVKLTLPEGVKDEGSEFAQLQEQFEKVLVDHGLLKDGIAATGDNVGRSVQETAGSAARKIRGGTAEYLADHPPTTDPATFTQTTHNVTSSSASATDSIYTVATKLGTVVGNVASSAGAWVTSKVPTTQETTDTLNQVGDAYTSTTGGIAAGVGQLKATMTEATGQVVENEWGREARDVGGDLAGSVGNITGSVGQAASVASGATVFDGGLKGAIEMENKQQLEMNREARQTSGQWQDVPV